MVTALPRSRDAYRGSELMMWIVSDDIVSYMDSRFSKQNLANPTFRELGSAMFRDT